MKTNLKERIWQESGNSVQAVWPLGTVEETLRFTSKRKHSAVDTEEHAEDVIYMICWGLVRHLCLREDFPAQQAARTPICMLWDMITVSVAALSFAADYAPPLPD